MKEQFIEILIPTIAVLIFICAFIYVRKTNPQNKKIVTRQSYIEYSNIMKERHNLDIFAQYVNMKLRKSLN